MVNNFDNYKIKFDKYKHSKEKIIDNLKQLLENNKKELIVLTHEEKQKFKYDDMIKKSYKYSHISKLLKDNDFKKIYKSKMPFRKTFEYIFLNNKYIKSL